MKDFKKQYYIVNVPWKNKLNYDSLLRFDNINCNDEIIFHFDFLNSIFKVDSKSKGYSKNIFISAINVCLRNYQIIHNIYPYNKIRVVIHINSKYKLSLDYTTFKTILDIIPDFAVCDGFDDSLDKEKYKHIFYGNCCNARYHMKNSDSQDWLINNGELNIRTIKKEGI